MKSVGLGFWLTTALMNYMYNSQTSNSFEKMGKKVENFFKYTFSCFEKSFII